MQSNETTGSGVAWANLFARGLPAHGDFGRGLCIPRAAGSRGSKPAAQRRASVLVLVMTLLSILFVLGVAFLATMNFEAERVAAEAQKRRTELGAEVLVDDIGGVVRSGLMADSDQPFAGNDGVGSLTAFTQIPGWHNAYSPVEPYAKSDGRVVWPWMVDLASVNEPQGICLGTNPPYVGDTCSSSAECGTWTCEELFICQDGPRSGGVCRPEVDCPGGFCDAINPTGPICKTTSDDPNLIGRACIPELSCPAGTCARAEFGGARWRGAELDTTWAVGAEGFEDIPGNPMPTRTWYQGRPLGTCAGGPRAGESCRGSNDCCLPNGDCGGIQPMCRAIRQICIGGVTDGRTCLTSADCAGGVCSAELVIPVDADGDGIVDSIQTNADVLGFSKEQIEQISSVVNGASDTSGNVYVGLRVVPHGGLVNLNDAHPTLIENVLNIRSVFDLPDPFNGVPLVRPAQEQVFYAPQQEEAVLRRRNFFPARTMPPTRLHGDPLVSEEARRTNPFGGADMPTQLFAPRSDSFESVFAGDHRFWPARPDEFFPDGNARFWAARMEPFVSFDYDGSQSQYDRRHLVTTVSHDALLSRGGQTVIDDQTRDLRELMMEVNGDYAGDCSVLPFELPDYPHDILNNTKPNDEGNVCQCPDLKVCSFDPRKGRLQLSLAWLDERIEQWITDVFNGVPDLINLAAQRKRLIYDYFYMLVRNAAGPEWEDVPCTLDGQCIIATERCSGNINKPGLCVDKVLNLPRHEARATRTAASLTANLLDYMDDRVCVGGELDGAPCNSDVDCGTGTAFCGPSNAPTRVAVRKFDFGGGECLKPQTGNVPTYAGEYCRTNDDCRDPLNLANSTLCSAQDPFNPIRSCAGGDKAGTICDDHNDCSGTGAGLGSGNCVAVTGREINIHETPDIGVRYEYVYGVEQQPFITEVATVAIDKDGSKVLDARAVELFNPSGTPIDLSAGYALVEVDNANNNPRRIPLAGALGAGRFNAVVDNKQKFDEIRTISLVNGQLTELPNNVNFTFVNGWTVYLVRTVRYAEPASPLGFVDVEVVLDAFPIEGTLLGRDDANPPASGWPKDEDGAEFTEVAVSAQRVVPLGRDWLAPVPHVVEQPPTDGTVADSSLDTLGGYNDFPGAATVARTIHPVEMQFPNTGWFTRPDPRLPNNDPNEKAVAFPTTGSLLMLMRYANHSLSDLQMPAHRTTLSSPLPVALRDRLAFTGWLNRQTVITNPVSGGEIARIRAREQIDNGRMPVFDVGIVGNDGNRHAANHRPPWQSTPGRPGGVANLPWGQLVFDYFTALPLANRGPFRPDPYNPTDPDTVYGAPGSRPRVDHRGLRVHGRIDLNAAPWTVLAGLPFIPLEEVPAAYRGRFRAALWGSTADPQVVDPIAQTLGALYPNPSDPPDPTFNPPAQAIVAYREARDGSPFFNVATTGDYRTDGVGRGYLNQSPAFRRGMGFLTVGELANVRHSGAADARYRLDTGLVVADPASNPTYDAGTVNYLDAIALLATLGDWVTVRSDVFTVYGVLRGEADPTVMADPLSDIQAELQRIEEVDARALRFQETIDRLPTFLGERLPSRVGDRTLANFKDVQND